VIPKAKWMFKDVNMYADKYQVKFNMNDAFPVNTLYLMRGAVYANKVNLLEKYNTVMFKAMWVENINLNDAKNIITVLNDNGFISKDFLEAAEDLSIKEALKNNTSKAVEKGIFGVPSFIVDGELYFGQDRMDWFIN
jgi:2-hydroxychromene-2-carboxylate isomerase